MLAGGIYRPLVLEGVDPIFTLGRCGGVWYLVFLMLVAVQSGGGFSVAGHADAVGWMMLPAISAIIAQHRQNADDFGIDCFDLGVFGLAVVLSF